MNKKIETLNEYKINDSTNTQVKIYHELIESIIKVAEHSSAENTQDAINLAWELFKSDDRLTLVFEDDYLN